MTTLTINSIQAFEGLGHTIEEYSIRLSPRFATYRPHLILDLETKNYRLKTATSLDELIGAFKLRHEIFLQDICETNEIYDVDEYDHRCDHLIIIDKESETIVGTYRVICSKFHHNFYSQSEFNLDNFLEIEGVKVELGRACITAGHRNGNVIDLLWRGIGQYSMKVQADYLFGCSSVKITEKQKAFDLCFYLKEKNLLEDNFNIRPIGKFKMNFKGLEVENPEQVKNLLPPLLKSYIVAGASIEGLPALDNDFACIDFLTVLNLKEVSSGFKRRYFTK